MLSNRLNLTNLLKSLFDTPINECVHRDPKGLEADTGPPDQEFHWV